MPSLAALRAFETTARHATYSAAASELNVTSAALRQHVRSLEAWFGCKLVRRAGRGVALTDHGTQFSRSLSIGFEQVAASVVALEKGAASRPVRVACTPAFAETWLIPRLPQFWEEHPDIEIDLAASQKNADLNSGEYDMAIRYGRGDWDWQKKYRLASAAYTIVAAPSYFNVMPEKIESAMWVFESGRLEHQRWALERGISFEGPNCRHYQTNSLVLSVTRAGQGLSVQSWALVERDVATGTLQIVSKEAGNDLAYYLLCASGRPAAAVFSSWLLKQRSEVQDHDKD